MMPEFMESPGEIWQLWCRLCAKEDAIGNVCIKDERMAPNLTLSMAIKKYFDLDILESDESSKMLCVNCFSLITSLVNFSELITKVQAMYKSLQETKTEAIDLSEMRTKYGVNDCEREPLANILTEIQCNDNQVNSEAENHQLSTKIKTESIWIDESSNKDDNHESCNSHNEDALTENEMIMKDIEGNNNQEIKNEFSSLLEGIEIEPVRMKRKRRRPLRLRHTDDSDDTNDHKNYEIQETKYTCTECGRTFRLLNHFRTHMKRTHNLNDIPKIPCTKCEKSFTTEYQLEKHQKIHLPLADKQCVPCSFCDKKFTSTHTMQTHVSIIHLGERSFICEECGITVRTKAALKAHLLTHTEERPEICDICKKGFKDKGRLKIHMEIHDPRKHVCSICGLQLNSRATLNRHLLVHSDQSKHKCDYCGREFKRAKALKSHLILHTGLKPYCCNFCDRTFANGSNCRSHKKKAHPEELAALEASGSKAFTKNIPKLELLKAVTKVAKNLTPVVTKHSGRFSFGMKPAENPTTRAVYHYRRVVLNEDNPSNFASEMDDSTQIEEDSNNENFQRENLLKALMNN